jgi:serine/threonine protein kinase
MWSLGCVFSLALVWSILGPGALKTYQRSLENATNRIPIMRDSAYVGCFHDGVKALEEVHAMHNQVVRACGRSDYIIHELVPIILGMLEEDPKQRFSAKEVRMKCRQALDRADKSLATEGSEFSSLFRTEGEATPHPETPKETNSITKTVADTSTGRSASIFHEPDVVIIDEAVSNTTKPNSYWKDTESSVYELLAEPRHVDTATTYSIDSSTDNPNTDYFRAFAEQLTKDLQIGSISTKLSDVPPSYINEALRMFTWKLHEESKDPFQWGVSVTLNREKRYVFQWQHLSFCSWMRYYGWKD